MIDLRYGMATGKLPQDNEYPLITKWVHVRRHDYSVLVTRDFSLLLIKIKQKCQETLSII